MKLWLSRVIPYCVVLYFGHCEEMTPLSMTTASERRWGGEVVVVMVPVLVDVY